MKILVTGGAGFIGSHIVRSYFNAGHSVVVVDDMSHGNRSRIPDIVPLYILDIHDQPGLERVLNHERPDVINHHAALVSVRDSERSPDDTLRVNYEDTIKVFEAGCKYQVGKFIFASSGGAVYGEAVSLPIQEDTKCQPLSPYGESKLLAEDALRARQGSMETLILRYGNVYGPGQDPLNNNSVIAIFLQKMIHNCQPVIFGDGNQIRDYIYVDDIAAVNKIALHPGISGTINIGTGIGHSLIEIYQKLAQKIQFPDPPLYSKSNSYEVFSNILDTGRAKAKLGWEASISLETGLDRTILSYVAQDRKGERALTTRCIGMQTTNVEDGI